jgi:hypothetical protein
LGVFLQLVQMHPAQPSLVFSTLPTCHTNTVF